MSEIEIIDLTDLTESSSGQEDDDDDNASLSGDSEEEVVVVDAPTRAKLHAAIFNVSEQRLRQVVADMMDTIPGVDSALAKEFLTLKRKSQLMGQRWEKCANCDDEFDVSTEREHDECNFHPGELNLDEASFVDWDEDTHGPMDTPSNRREYPENFKWSCCGNDGLSEGCVTGQHEIAVPQKKRRFSSE